jgi:alkylhydroperoxidase family enzyme
LTDDEIAALDSNWAEFPPAQRAAFTLARKLTYEPYRITDADIDQLRKHYKDLQILEMIFSVSANNSTNRWKEGVGTPLEKEGTRFLKSAKKPPAKDRVLPIKTFLTPVSEQYKNKLSQVAPLQDADNGGQPSRLAVCRRPELEPRAEVEKALAACRQRTPRLPLVAEAEARKILPKDWPQGPLPQWVRLLANFPRDGKSRITGLRTAEEKGDLKPLFKAQASWIIARQDHAWYALGQAQNRLRELGWSDDQIYQLDGSWAEFTPAERALFKLARNLAAAPIVLTDQDVEAALKLAGPRLVVQLIGYTTGKAFFNRVTEAAGLQLESGKGSLGISTLP